MGYAIINERGIILQKSKVPILKVKEGERVSFITDGSVHTSVDLGPHTLCMHYKKCKAKITQSFGDKERKHYLYRFEVVGANPSDVEKFIKRIERFIGVKNISLGKLELPFDLPKLRSFFGRLKFFWDDIVHGKVAYYSELSQEELDRQYDEAMDDYKKKEAEKVNKEMDENLAKYEEEKLKEREKREAEEEEQSREDEGYPEDDIPREVNFGDSPGGFKGYE